MSRGESYAARDAFGSSGMPTEYLNPMAIPSLRQPIDDRYNTQE
jgi:hypothetical protein